MTDEFREILELDQATSELEGLALQLDEYTKTLGSQCLLNEPA